MGIFQSNPQRNFLKNSGEITEEIIRRISKDMSLRIPKDIYGDIYKRMAKDTFKQFVGSFGGILDLFV